MVAGLTTQERARREQVAAGGGGADRGRGQWPGGGEAVPDVADAGEPVAAALAGGGCAR